MTLAELLIVLAILAITSVVALQAVTPLMDQARVDSTIKTLNNIAGAIVSNNPTGVAGFIADNGRLPGWSFGAGAQYPPTGTLPVDGIPDLTGYYTGSGVLTQPSDLPASSLVGVVSINWNSSAGLWSATTAVPPTTTGTYLCTLAAGWRGPYLNSPPGTTFLPFTSSESVPNITDGWGYSLSTDPLLASVFSISTTTYNVTLLSPGSNTGPTGVISTIVPSSSFMASGFTVSIISSSKVYYVMIIGPGPAANNGLSICCISAGGLTGGATLSILPTSVDAGTNAAIGVQPFLVGPRVLLPITSMSSPISGSITYATPTNIVVQPGAMTVTMSF